jgi:hypothetical protein
MTRVLALSAAAAAIWTATAAAAIFRVPRVPAGRYTIVVWCKPCGNDHWAMATPSYIQNGRAVLRVRA